MEFKTKGNQSFKNENYEEAIKYYTDGLSSDFENKYILYSNRSAANLKLKKIDEATSDAVESCLLNPKWPKGWSRLYECLKILKKDDLASKCLERKNELIEKTNSKKIEKPNIVLNNGQPNMQDMISKISSSQTFKNKMNDRNFMKKLEENKSNPFALLSDPTIMGSFQEIMKDIKLN